MRPIVDLVRELHRPNVTEVALASGRLPCRKEGGTYVPVDRAAVDEPELVRALATIGGEAFVGALSEKPSSWTHRQPGVGLVAIMAVRRGGSVQARLTLREREEPRASQPGPLDFELDASPATGPASAAPKAISVGPSSHSAPSVVPPPAAPVPTLGGALELELDLDIGAGASIGLGEAVASASSRASASPPALGGIADVAVSLEGGRLVSSPIAPDPAPVDFGARAPSARPPAGVALPGELFDLLSAARRKHATDVHIGADRLATFRRLGALAAESGYLSAAQVSAMLMPIVPPLLVATLERTGSCDFALEDPKLGRFRVNVARQRSGLKGCFRLISREIPQLSMLGVPLAIAESTKHHQGLILLTGPTGSGKSTTLAALVDILNRESTHHIVTIEDPIEHVHVPKKALISQRQVGLHTRSFETALKASLREDPDVIVVGELRDTETVRMALTASETGHLVLGTMNTPSAAKTIERLIDLFPPADQGQVRMTLAGGLRLIVGQRLIPSLQGGMVAATEMLPGNVPLWALIRENRTFQIPSLQQRGKQLGIIRLDDQLMDMVKGGRISMDSARFVAESPDFGR